MGEVADDVNDTWEIWEHWDWVRRVFGVLRVRWRQLAVTDIGVFCLAIGLCLNGHIRFRADIKNAVKYARNSEHLSKTQDAIHSNQVSSHDSVIIHPQGIMLLAHQW